MKLRVKLFATLARYAPTPGLSGTPFEMEMPEGANLGDLVLKLRLPVKEVKICFVNGRVQELPFLLTEGDECGIFPPVGGG
jgi:molybdopterin converting factor small subunit